MINVSNEFKRTMKDGAGDFLSHIDITLKDGTKLETLDNADLMGNGFKIDDGVTASGQFTIGSCIINKLTVTLNNIYDKFSSYDFDGATVTAYLGLELSGGRIEKIRKGVFTVDDPQYNDSTITLECLDNMHKLGRDYSEVKTTYPATLQKIVRDICSTCGITLLTTTFDNGSYSVKNRPNDDALTCRQVLAYCAQIACKFARFDTYGRLCLDWFAQGVFESGDNLNGGLFEQQQGIKGIRNLLVGSGQSIWSSEYFMRRFAVAELKPKTTYTLVLNGKSTTPKSHIKAYTSDAKYELARLPTGQDGVAKAVFATPDEIKDNYINFWDMSGGAGYNAVIYWACLYEGDVDAPMNWVPPDGVTQYEIADTADGGNFINYESGDIANAGAFEDMNKFHHLYSMSSLTVSTDDVVITGISVTEEFEETEKLKKKTVQYGKSGYVLSISGNPFVYSGKANEVSTYLGQKLVGLKFRPLSGSFLGDPTIEAGDLMYVTDRKQRTYNCLVTNLTFTVGNYMNVSCDAETPGKNSAKQYSELTQAIVQARKNTEVQISEYDKTVQQLTTLITQSFGVFKTEEVQSDGSIIHYMHDKPTLAESKTIWKMTADAFAVSTDGGKTWNAGMDSSGNAVVNVLSAIGISFDWARGGTLTLGGVNNKSGLLKVLDSAGNEIGRWSNSGINITKGSIYNKTSETGSSIYGGRMHVSYGEDDLGFIGAQRYASDPNSRGLVFNLDVDGDYIGWGAKRSTSDRYYYSKLTYASRGRETMLANSLNAGCDFDMHNYELRNVNWPGGGVSGTLDFVRIVSVRGDGAISSWTPGRHMTFKNGILIDAAF